MSPSFPPRSEPNPADALAETHRLALAELREMGMDIARDLHASAREEGADLGEIATRYARVARAVRQTIALEARLVEMARLRANEGKKIPDEIRWELGRAKVARRRLAVAGVVGGAILASGAQGAERDRLETSLYEYLGDREQGELYGDVPLHELIKRICGDLGLSPDWHELPDRHWNLTDDNTRSGLQGQFDDDEDDDDFADSAPPPASTSGYNPPDPWPRGPP